MTKSELKSPHHLMKSFTGLWIWFKVFSIHVLVCWFSKIMAQN